jgi:SPP1 gp7 family putative phage head morphogenesis protein
MRVRIGRIRQAVEQLIVVDDAFGLRQVINQSLVDNQIRRRFAFLSTERKVQEFQQFVAAQTQLHLLEQDWWNSYVEEGFRRGAGRSFDAVRKKQKILGSQAKYEGSKMEFLRSSFANPESVTKVKLLAGRVYTELKGVSDDMAVRMSRTLTDGFVEGKNALTIARDLKKQLGLSTRRAETIARTEIIRAHAEGELTALEQLGVTEVGVMVEWSTAGDTLVCPLCGDLEGIVLKTSEAHGLIPRHPNCRCAYIPANVGEDATGQVRSQSKIQDAIDDSIKREGPKKSTLAKQKQKTSWAGADKTIAKRRPKSILKK